MQTAYRGTAARTTTKGYGLHLFSPEWFDPDAKRKKKPFKSPTVIPTVNAQDIVRAGGCLLG